MSVFTYCSWLDSSNSSSNTTENSRSANRTTGDISQFLVLPTSTAVTTAAAARAAKFAKTCALCWLQFPSVHSQWFQGTFAGLSKQVRSSPFSPDGQNTSNCLSYTSMHLYQQALQLACAGAHGWLQVCSVPSQQCQVALLGHDNWLHLPLLQPRWPQIQTAICDCTNDWLRLLMLAPIAACRFGLCPVSASSSPSRGTATGYGAAASAQMAAWQSQAVMTRLCVCGMLPHGSASGCMMTTADMSTRLPSTLMGPASPQLALTMLSR